MLLCLCVCVSVLCLLLSAVPRLPLSSDHLLISLVRFLVEQVWVECNLFWASDLLKAWLTT